jgi:transcription elongation factor GreB
MIRAVEAFRLVPARVAVLRSMTLILGRQRGSSCEVLHSWCDFFEIRARRSSAMRVVPRGHQFEQPCSGEPMPPGVSDLLSPAWAQADPAVSTAHMSRRRAPVAKQTPYITPQGEQRLRDEFDRLWHEERPRVTREVTEAAAQGDRSENAEYIYGKKRLREIDARVEFLDKRLEELTVVRDVPVDDGTIYFGAWVRLEDAEGEERVYRIVGPDEFDVEQGRISVDSPLGRALMRKQEGDAVVVRRPRGDATYEILDVRYRPFEPD